MSYGINVQKVKPIYDLYWCLIVEILLLRLLFILQGRSALWSHLVHYQEVERAREGDKPIDPNLLTPGKLCIGKTTDSVPLYLD